MNDDVQRDLFFDDYQFAITPFGVSIDLRASIPMRQGDAMPRFRQLPILRMNHATAKVLVYQLVRRLAAHEQDYGEIPVAAKLLNQCAIGAEDWTDFWTRARSTEIKP